jgi:hypothetical protein
MGSRKSLINNWRNLVDPPVDHTHGCLYTKTTCCLSFQDVSTIFGSSHLCMFRAQNEHDNVYSLCDRKFTLIPAYRVISHAAILINDTTHISLCGGIKTQLNNKGQHTAREWSIRVDLPTVTGQILSHTGQPMRQLGGILADQSGDSLCGMGWPGGCVAGSNVSFLSAEMFLHIFLHFIVKILNPRTVRTLATRRPFFCYMFEDKN